MVGDCPCYSSVDIHCFGLKDRVHCSKLRPYLSSVANKIKHRVQNPQCVTKPKLIASTHAQICPRIIIMYAFKNCECGISKILLELACT